MKAISYWWGFNGGLAASAMLRPETILNFCAENWRVQRWRIQITHDGRDYRLMFTGAMPLDTPLNVRVRR